jgi:recA bacterial DNA recombination protein
MRVEQLIKEKFNIDPLSMRENTSVDVSKFDVKVLSFNIKSEENEFSRILSVIRKPDSKFSILTFSDNSTIKCTGEHKFYVNLSEKLSWSFMTLEDIVKNMIKYEHIKFRNNDSKEIELISSITKLEKAPIFDLEIENNHNLYTNTVLSHNSMGDVNVPTGGNAWKFYPDMRIKIFKQLDRENETNDTTIEIVKNKCGKPFGKCKIPIAWGIGIDKTQEIINIAVDKNIIKKSGSWYAYGEMKLGQGAEGVKELLNDNKELLEEIRVKILE